ncbi:MAG TPA: hypothetical protein VKR54_01020 [Candidatus Babeliales bacterium]|jgi:hypothetical protein|nr:hypothetical protein [Candidatus Babeliales bacterium]
MNSKINREYLANVTPELLKKLRHITLIESIGSSMRLAGSKFSDREVKNLLAKVKPDSYNKRVKQNKE